MLLNLDEINNDILNKIDSLDVDKNIKDFLKEALYEEYNHRDENLASISRRNKNYTPIIEKYYKGE